MSSYKELNEKYLNAVIKHEMLHTLGLKDIYDETLKKETLMYCSLDRDGNTFMTLVIVTNKLSTQFIDQLMMNKPDMPSQQLCQKKLK